MLRLETKFALLALLTGVLSFGTSAAETPSPNRLPEPGSPADLLDEATFTPAPKKLSAPPESHPIPAAVKRPEFGPIPPVTPKGDDGKSNAGSATPTPTPPVPVVQTPPVVPPSNVTAVTSTPPNTTAPNANVAANPAPVPDEPPHSVNVKTIYPADVGLRIELAEAVEIAVQNNLGLQLSRLSDRSVDYTVRIAWSQFFPTFTPTINHTNQDSVGKGEPSSTGNTVIGTGVTQRSPWGTEMNLQFLESRNGTNGGTRNVNANFIQPLWRGAGTDANLRELRVARIQRLISRGTLELDTQNLIFRVRTNYANIIRVLQTREVDREALDSAIQFLNFTKERTKQGIATPLDQSQAELQVNQRRLNLVQDERQLGASYDRLKQDMDVMVEENLLVVPEKIDFGDVPPEQMKEDDKFLDVLETDYDKGIVYLQRRDAKTKTEKVGESKVIFQAQHFDEVKVMSEALQNRVDLLNSRRNMAITQLNTLAAKNNTGYQVDLVGGYGHDRFGVGDRARSTTSDVNRWNVGVQATVPWGKIADKALYEQALLNLQASEIGLKDAQYQVQLSVRDIMRVLREGESTILIDAERVEQAKRTVRATFFAFKNGFRNSFEVTQVKDALLQAKSDYINATLIYVTNLAQLEVVIGKPTGRVDLAGETLGGEILSRLPDSLSSKPIPRRAPLADPSCEDHALNNSRAYRCDPKPEPDTRLHIVDPRTPPCNCEIIEHKP